MATPASTHKPPPCPRGRCAEHRIAIAAPAEAVWATLIDFTGWGEWNPLYVETAGALLVGTEITMTVQLAGMKPQHARATVRTLEPPALIEYAMSQLGGLLRAFRYIELIPTGAASCRVANGEIMSGPIGKLVARLMGAKVREGLRGMNEALKRRVEAAAADAA